MNSFAALITKIKYHLTRFIVLIVAIHIIDVSVDIDFLHVNEAFCDAERYDDVDSISEFILEKVAGDNDLTRETGSDDQHPLHKELNKVQLAPFYPDLKAIAEQDLTMQALVASRPRSRNTAFRLEDHSLIDDNPPELAAPSTL